MTNICPQSFFRSAAVIVCIGEPGVLVLPTCPFYQRIRFTHISVFLMCPLYLLVCFAYVFCFTYISNLPTCPLYLHVQLHPRVCSTYAKQIMEHMLRLKPSWSSHHSLHFHLSLSMCHVTSTAHSDSDVMIEGAATNRSQQRTFGEFRDSVLGIARPCRSRDSLTQANVNQLSV